MKYLLIIVLLFTFALVTAKDKDGQFESYDPRSCGDWVHARKVGGVNQTADATWISGYITAYNLQTPDVYSIIGNTTDMKSVYLWMDQYCRENPLSRMVEGMQVLTYELWPKRKRTQ